MLKNFLKLISNRQAFKKVSEGNYELVGNLTMLDVTKPVTLAVEYAGIIKVPGAISKPLLQFREK